MKLCTPVKTVFSESQQTEPRQVYPDQRQRKILQHSRNHQLVFINHHRHHTGWLDADHTVRRARYCYGISVGPSVRPSVCLSNAGIVSKN